MLISLPEVAVQCGVSTRTIDRWLRDPALNFPRPLKIGAKNIRFDSVEIALWLASSRVQAS